MPKEPRIYSAEEKFLYYARRANDERLSQAQRDYAVGYMFGHGNGAGFLSPVASAALSDDRTANGKGYAAARLADDRAAGKAPSFDPCRLKRRS
jgi:hypothetical protein